jgi:serine/threonine protein phosphatase PrpC
MNTPKAPRIRLSSSIARPDEASALANVIQKRNKEKDIKASAEMVRGPGAEEIKDETTGGLQAPKVNLLTTPCGETCISKKEEALEQIMCAEAFAGFERMARHHLNRDAANRTAIDPRKVDLDMRSLADQHIDNSDIADPDSDSDAEMITRYEFAQSHAGFGEDVYNASQTWGLRMGFGFCAPAENGESQERIFFSRCGNYKLMGIINSHGHQEVGPVLARFIAEELPNSFFKSPWLTQENDPVTALNHAFDRTHRKAIKTIDCNLTGACCTALLMDETSIYIAHVGACRAVLAMPDPNVNAQKYHFIPVALTEDHKLSVRGEFDRALEYGGEVRRCVNDNVHRLFFTDDYVPGLTVTRGIGHRMAHPIGVSHIPSIQVLQRQELQKDAFIILASGGVWHAMSERGAVNWIGRHFVDPGEAAESLAAECKRRWMDPSTRLQAFVSQGGPESFGSMILYPSVDALAAESLLLEAAQPPRQFQLGPHDTQVARRPWKDVRKVDWKSDLACIMNGGRLNG